MVRNYEQFMNLAKVANGTFGTTGVNPARVSTQSVKFEAIDENTLKVSYMAMITVASKSMQLELENKHKSDALAMIKVGIERFVEGYKEMMEQNEKSDLPLALSATGKKPEPVKATVKLSLKDFTITPSVELVSYSAYKPQQQAFYRLSALVDVK